MLGHTRLGAWCRLAYHADAAFVVAANMPMQLMEI
jgi:hypothetical protein